jgi:ribosomal protein L7/L12
MTTLIVKTNATKKQPALYLRDIASPGNRAAWEILSELATPVSEDVAYEIKNRLEAFGANVELLPVNA